MVDTETANTWPKEGGVNPQNQLVYDIGWQVVDKYGKVYSSASYVNSDIYCHEKELMANAYYAKKLPQYQEDIQAGRRKLANTYEIRQAMLGEIDKYKIKAAVAHNARFDLTALNNTLKYTTKSKYRYWFPYSIEIWDTMKMAQSVIFKMPTYQKFCQKYRYYTATGRLKCTAEILWKFISKNPNFQEAHTGLEDVAIEAQILAYCYKQHKAMQKLCFPNQKRNDPPTEFQRALSASMKKIPVLTWN